MERAAKKIGENIQRFRKRARWTQAVLSKITGIPQGQISAYENGRDVPKIENMARLANAFNCSVAAIDRRLAKIGVPDAELQQDVLDDIDRAILSEIEDLPKRAKLQLLTRIGEIRAELGLTTSSRHNGKNDHKSP